MDIAISQIMTALAAAAMLTIAPLPLRAQLPLSTGTLSCGTSLDMTAAVNHRTRAVFSPDKRMSAFAEIDFRWDETAPVGAHCLGTYRLLVTDPAGKVREVKSFSESRDDPKGVSIVGFSPDGNMVAAEFFRMYGDYTTSPLAVVANLKTGIVKMRDLLDSITKQLPSCDYQQDITGVTNMGDVIVRIPTIQFGGADEGSCGAQGRWLFDLTTGKAHRLAAKPVSRWPSNSTPDSYSD